MKREEKRIEKLLFTKSFKDLTVEEMDYVLREFKSKEEYELTRKILCDSHIAFSSDSVDLSMPADSKPYLLGYMTRKNGRNNIAKASLIDSLASLFNARFLVYKIGLVALVLGFITFYNPGTINKGFDSQNGALQAMDSSGLYQQFDTSLTYSKKPN